MKKNKLFYFFIRSFGSFLFFFVIQTSSFDAVKNIFNRTIAKVKQGYSWIVGSRAQQQKDHKQKNILEDNFKLIKESSIIKPLNQKISEIIIEKKIPKLKEGKDLSNMEEEKKLKLLEDIFAKLEIDKKLHLMKNKRFQKKFIDNYNSYVDRYSKKNRIDKKDKNSISEEILREKFTKYEQNNIKKEKIKNFINNRKKNREKNLRSSLSKKNSEGMPKASGYNKKNYSSLEDIYNEEGKGNISNIEKINIGDNNSTVSSEIENKIEAILIPRLQQVSPSENQNQAKEKEEMRQEEEKVKVKNEKVIEEQRQQEKVIQKRLSAVGRKESKQKENNSFSQVILN